MPDSPNIHFIKPRGYSTWVKVHGEEQTADLSEGDVETEIALLQDTGWKIVRVLEDSEHEKEYMLSQTFPPDEVLETTEVPATE